MINDPLRPEYFKDMCTGKEYEIPMGKISHFVHVPGGYKLVVENSDVHIVISVQDYLTYHNQILHWSR